MQVYTLFTGGKNLRKLGLVILLKVLNVLQKLCMTMSTAKIVHVHVHGMPCKGVDLLS